MGCITKFYFFKTKATSLLQALKFSNKGREEKTTMAQQSEATWGHTVHVYFPCWPPLCQSSFFLSYILSSYQLASGIRPAALAAILEPQKEMGGCGHNPQ